MMDEFDHKEVSVIENKRKTPRFAVFAWISGVALIVAMVPLFLTIFIFILSINFKEVDGWMMFALIIIISFITIPVSIVFALKGYSYGMALLENEKNGKFKIKLLIVIDVLIILSGLFYGYFLIKNLFYS